MRPARPLLASRLARWTTTGRPRETDEGALDVTDVVYVLLTLAVFGLLALAARGVERL
ncbi:hypothetical protein GCM10028783_27720 [Modestobacter muralis]